MNKAQRLTFSKIKESFHQKIKLQIFPGKRKGATKFINKMNENNKGQLVINNIIQLGFIGLPAFDFHFSVFLGGQEYNPKTQSFHIVKHYA